MFNTQTAGSNAFQQHISATDEEVARRSIREFDEFAQRLREKDVEVLVIEDTQLPVKPDAVFPNNWITLHHDGSVVLYPMFAPNRRYERRPEIIDMLREKFYIREVIDLSEYESQGIFLEGTGSIIFDHVYKIAYACLSPRTNEQLFRKVCDRLGYEPITFYAYDRAGMEIYHTNVMMCVGEKFSVVCMDSIRDIGERTKVGESLFQSGHDIIEITQSQMTEFAGNMLSVRNRKGEAILVLSQSAYNSLSKLQVIMLEKYCELLPMPIETIESVGGGSARCMMAEVFLPLRSEVEKQGLAK